jgi:hypothetical protein
VEQKPKGGQLEDKDSNFEDNIVDPDGIKGIPEREPSAINDGLSSMNEDMSEDYYSGLDKEDTTLSVCKR